MEATVIIKNVCTVDGTHKLTSLISAAAKFGAQCLLKPFDFGTSTKVELSDIGDEFAEWLIANQYLANPSEVNPGYVVRVTYTDHAVKVLGYAFKTWYVTSNGLSTNYADALETSLAGVGALVGNLSNANHVENISVERIAE